MIVKEVQVLPNLSLLWLFCTFTPRFVDISRFFWFYCFILIQNKQEAKGDGLPPGKYGNTELIKIPNFLHLTPKHIEKHCKAIKSEFYFEIISFINSDIIWKLVQRFCKSLHVSQSDGSYSKPIRWFIF